MARRSERRSTLAIVLVVASFAATGIVMTAASATASTVPACLKPSTDVRYPYNNGTCPAGFTHVNLVTGYSGVAVCTKLSTDYRAPYNNGTCPAGFTLVWLVTGGAIPICVKPSTDVRAPYNNGTCPAGFTKYWVTDAAVTPTELPDSAATDPSGRP